MAQEPDLSCERPEAIRQRIDETRSSLTEKLETLEKQVRGTVQGARATVEETIETVKATVQETVESVGRALDLKHQTRQHPWPMVGGSVLAGFLTGSLVDGSRQPGARLEHQPAPGTSAQPSPAPAIEGAKANGGASGSLPPSMVARSAGPGMLDKLAQTFDEEIQQVKGLAIGVALGLLRDMAKEALPPTIAPEVEQIINNATVKLGGKLIQGPMLEPAQSWRRRDLTRADAAW